jgi:hypothetical protein
LELLEQVVVMLDLLTNPEFATEMSNDDTKSIFCVKHEFALYEALMSSELVQIHYSGSLDKGINDDLIKNNGFSFG